MTVENRKTQRGSVLVEMALVLPMLLLIVLGGIDLNLMAGAKSALNYIAGEAARCGAQVNTPCSPSTYVSQAAPGLGLKASSVGPPVTTICGPGVLGTSCQVTITYTWTPISPFFKAATLTSTASAPAFP